MNLRKDAPPSIKARWLAEPPHYKHPLRHVMRHAGYYDRLRAVYMASHGKGREVRNILHAALDVAALGSP